MTITNIEQYNQAQQQIGLLLYQCEQFMAKQGGSATIKSNALMGLPETPDRILVGADDKDVRQIIDGDWKDKITISKVIGYPAAAHPKNNWNGCEFHPTDKMRHHPQAQNVENMVVSRGGKWVEDMGEL